jgi:hypothetical protein
MSRRDRTKGLPRPVPDVLPADRGWRPLGHLIQRTPGGGWYMVERGCWQHYPTAPSDAELREERAWLAQRRKDMRRNRKSA